MHPRSEKDDRAWKAASRAEMTSRKIMNMIRDEAARNNQFMLIVVIDAETQGSSMQTNLPHGAIPEVLYQLAESSRDKIARSGKIDA